MPPACPSINPDSHPANVSFFLNYSLSDVTIDPTYKYPGKRTCGFKGAAPLLPPVLSFRFFYPWLFGRPF